MYPTRRSLRPLIISLIYRTFLLGVRAPPCWPASCDGMQEARYPVAKND